MNKKVAIQESNSSNHHQVVNDTYDSEPNLVQCDSFDMLVSEFIDDNASSLYNLDIIVPSVQSTTNNEASFLFVSKDKKEMNFEKIDKASIRFIVDRKRGSLAALLNVMSDCRLNLTKIQSLPVLEKPWKYSFFVDVIFEELSHFEKAKSLLKIMAKEFIVLGEYKNVKL